MECFDKEKMFRHNQEMIKYLSNGLNFSHILLKKTIQDNKNLQKIYNEYISVDKKNKRILDKGLIDLKLHLLSKDSKDTISKIIDYNNFGKISIFRNITKREAPALKNFPTDQDIKDEKELLSQRLAFITKVANGYYEKTLLRLNNCIELWQNYDYSKIKADAENLLVHLEGIKDFCEYSYNEVNKNNYLEL